MIVQPEPQVVQPEAQVVQSELQQRPAPTVPPPASAVTCLAPDQWAELVPGEAVWVERAGYGFDAGYVDDVSQHQEIIWVEIPGGGRRLFCSDDPVHLWTSDVAKD